MASSAYDNAASRANEAASISTDKTRHRSKKTGEIVKEEVVGLGVMGRDAIFSGSWVWPLRGLLHMVHHPSLFVPIRGALIKSTGFTIGVTALLFIFLYLPHVAVLAFVSGPLAFAAAVPIILGEGAAIGLAVSRAFWIGEALEDLFDEVLMREDCGSVLGYGRDVDDSSTGKSLGKLISGPINARFSKEAIIRWLISLPLNLIPVVGTAIFFFYNGSKGGPGWHARYFQLRELEAKTATGRRFNKQEWIKKYKGAYAGFGTVALLLNLVPGAIIFAMFSNTVGAALWATRIEKEGSSGVVKGAQHEVAQAKNVAREGKKEL